MDDSDLTREEWDDLIKRWGMDDDDESPNDSIIDEEELERKREDWRKLAKASKLRPESPSPEQEAWRGAKQVSEPLRQKDTDDFWEGDEAKEVAIRNAFAHGYAAIQDLEGRKEMRFCRPTKDKSCCNPQCYCHEYQYDNDVRKYSPPKFDDRQMKELQLESGPELFQMDDLDDEEPPTPHAPASNQLDESIPPRPGVYTDEEQKMIAECVKRAETLSPTAHFLISYLWMKAVKFMEKAIKMACIESVSKKITAQHYGAGMRWLRMVQIFTEMAVDKLLTVPSAVADEMQRKAMYYLTTGDLDLFHHYNLLPTTHEKPDMPSSEIKLEIQNLAAKASPYLKHKAIRWWSRATDYQHQIKTLQIHMKTVHKRIQIESYVEYKAAVQMFRYLCLDAMAQIVQAVVSESSMWISAMALQIDAFTHNNMNMSVIDVHKVPKCPAAPFRATVKAFVDKKNYSLKFQVLWEKCVGLLEDAKQCWEKSLKHQNSPLIGAIYYSRAHHSIVVAEKKAEAIPLKIFDKGSKQDVVASHMLSEAMYFVLQDQNGTARQYLPFEGDFGFNSDLEIGLTVDAKVTIRQKANLHYKALDSSQKKAMYDQLRGAISSEEKAMEGASSGSETKATMENEMLAYDHIRSAMDILFQDNLRGKQLDGAICLMNEAIYYFVRRSPRAEELSIIPIKNLR